MTLSGLEGGDNDNCDGGDASPPCSWVLVTPPWGWTPPPPDSGGKGVKTDWNTF